jgi:hypothetical protein
MGDADSGDRADKGLVLRPPACWNCGFESRQGNVSCECCVFSDRGLCDGPSPRPEESYRVCVCVCVCVCVIEVGQV